jgi:hypothetical protein
VSPQPVLRFSISEPQFFLLRFATFSELEQLPVGALPQPDSRSRFQERQFLDARPLVI